MYPNMLPVNARQDPSPRCPQRAHRFRHTKDGRRIGAGQARGMNFWRSKSSSQIFRCCVAIWCLLRSSPRRSWPRPTPPFEGSTNRSCILGLLLPKPLVHSHPWLASSKTLGSSSNISKHAVCAFQSPSQSLHKPLGCNIARRALPSSAPH
jgi:hypothetical protein